MKTTFTTGQLTKLLELAEQKNVTPESFQEGLRSGLIADMFEALSLADLSLLDRNMVRQSMGLAPISSIKIPSFFEPSDSVRIAFITNGNPSEDSVCAFVDGVKERSGQHVWWQRDAIGFPVIYCLKGNNLDLAKEAVIALKSAMLPAEVFSF